MYSTVGGVLRVLLSPQLAAGRPSQHEQCLLADTAKLPQQRGHLRTVPIRGHEVPARRDESEHQGLRGDVPAFNPGMLDSRQVQYVWIHTHSVAHELVP